MNTVSELPSELIPIRMTIGAGEITAYAEMSGDFNPIHMDAEAARSAGMNDVIAHGTLTLNLIWESIERNLDLSNNPELTLDVRFKAPVYRGETVETGSALQPGKSAYDVWVSNQDGLRVIECTLGITPTKQPQTK